MEDTKKLKWERQGECNNCGYCCEFLGPQAIHITPKKDEVLDHRFHKLRQPAYLDNERAIFWYHIQAPCTEHDEENKKCKIYDDRPKICQLFPTFPTQVEGTPCSYYFEATTAEGKLIRRGGQGSPYPTMPLEAMSLLKKDETPSS